MAPLAKVFVGLAGAIALAWLLPILVALVARGLGCTHDPERRAERRRRRLMLAMVVRGPWRRR